MEPAALASDTGRIRGRLRLEQLFEAPARLCEPDQAEVELDNGVANDVEHGIVFLLDKEVAAAAGDGDAASGEKGSEAVAVAVHLDLKDPGGRGQGSHWRRPHQAAVLH